jgi:hypothetical protein
VLGGKVVGCAVALGSTVTVGRTIVVSPVVPGSTIVVGAMMLGGTVGLVFADQAVVEWRAIPRVIRGLGPKPAVGGHFFGAEPTDRGRCGSFHAVPAVAVAGDPDGSWITGGHAPERLATAGLDSVATSRLGGCLPRLSFHRSATRPQPAPSTPGASVWGPEELVSAG